MKELRALALCTLPILFVTGCPWGARSAGVRPPDMVWSDGLGHQAEGATEPFGIDPAPASDPAPTRGRFAAPAFPVENLTIAGVNKLQESWLQKNPMHMLVHIDVFADGEKVVVPANLGIVPEWGTASIHTHYENGVVYITDSTVQDMTLGQFFTILGVDLSCAAVYVDGTPVADPAAQVFADRQEIAVVFGAQPAEIPLAYDF